MTKMALNKTDRQTTLITSSTAETTIVTAGGTNDKRHPYSIRINNKSASDTTVAIRDSTGGDVVEEISVKAGSMAGWALKSEDAVRQTNKNSNWTAQSSASVDSLRIVVQFVEETAF